MRLYIKKHAEAVQITADDLKILLASKNPPVIVALCIDQPDAQKEPTGQQFVFFCRNSTELWRIPIREFQGEKSPMPQYFCYNAEKKKFDTTPFQIASAHRPAILNSVKNNSQFLYSFMLANSR